MTIDIFDDFNVYDNSKSSIIYSDSNILINIQPSLQEIVTIDVVQIFERELNKKIYESAHNNILVAIRFNVLLNLNSRSISVISTCDKDSFLS